MYLLIHFMALTLFFLAENAFRVIFPLFITEYLHYGRHYSGYFLVLFSLGGISAKFISGALADKFGKIRIYGSFLFLTALIAYAYGVVITIYILFFARFTHGFCAGAVYTVYKPITASLTTEKHLGRSLGFMGVASMVGLMIGAPIVVKLSDTYTYGNIFSYLCVIYLCAALAASLIKINENSATPLKRGINSFIEIKAILPLAALRLIHNMSYGLFIAYGVIFVRETSLAKSAFFLTAFALGNMITRPLTGYITDRTQQWYPIAVLAYLLMVCGYGTFSMQFMLTGAFVIGIGTGIEYTTINYIVYKNTPKSDLNRISATMEIVSSIATGVGACIAGLLYSGPLNKLFLFVAAMYLFQIFIITIFTLGMRRRNSCWNY